MLILDNKYIDNKYNLKFTFFITIGTYTLQKLWFAKINFKMVKYYIP